MAILFVLIRVLTIPAEFQTDADFDRLWAVYQFGEVDDDEIDALLARWMEAELSEVPDARLLDDAMKALAKRVWT